MRAYKRLFDVVAASVGLLVLVPVFLLIAVAIKLESPGPIFFRQERVGLGGRRFRIFKFRTMQHASEGVSLTVAGDSRITRIGAMLRRYKLDELAQLIDVLRGTMSLVGPRPEVPHYVDLYPPAWRDRLLSVRPGMTDFASIRYRDENELLAHSSNPEQDYVNHILPAKLQHALAYVDNPSLANDLRVLGLTLQTVFSPGSHARDAVQPSDHPLVRKGWCWLNERMARLRPGHGLWVCAVDAALILACWHLTYLFRLGFERWRPGRPWYDDAVSLGVVAIYSLCIAWAGTHKALWRFFGFADFKRLASATLVSGALCAALILAAQLVEVARAVLVLHPLFSLVTLSLVRMSYRVLYEHAHMRAQGLLAQQRRAIVLGAGTAAHRLLAGLHRRDGWTVLALLDDDTAKVGLQISGVPVLGPLRDVLEPHIRLRATHVIVAMPGASKELRDQAILLAAQTGLTVLRVPSQDDLTVPTQFGAGGSSLD